MSVFNRLNELSHDEVDELVQSLSQTIIKAPHISSKTVRKSLIVLESMVALNRAYDFNEVNLIIDSQEKAIVQNLIEEAMDSQLKKVYVSNHPSDALGVALAIALETEAKTIVMVDDKILNYGKTFEALVQIANYNPNIVIVFYDVQDNLLKHKNFMDSMIKNVRLSQAYLTIKKDLKSILSNPIGRPFLDTLSKVRDGLKDFMIEPTIFSQFNFDYHGAIDGYNRKELDKIFSESFQMEGANLIHLDTSSKPLQKLNLPSFKLEEGIPDYYLTYTQALDQKLKEFDDITVCININKAEDHMAEYAINFPDHYYVGNGTYHTLVDFVKGLKMVGKRVVIILSSHEFKHVAPLIQEQILGYDNTLIILRDSGLNEDGSAVKQGVYDISYASVFTRDIYMGQDINESVGILDYLLNQESFPLSILRIPNAIEPMDDRFELKWINQFNVHPDNKAILVSFGPSYHQLVNKISVNKLNIGLININSFVKLDYFSFDEVRCPIYVYDIEDYNHTLFNLLSHRYRHLNIYNLTIRGVDLSHKPRDIKQLNGLNIDHVLNTIIQK